MKRRTNLIFFVLVIDKTANNICRSKNGEASVLNLKKRFAFDDHSDYALTAECQVRCFFFFLMFFIFFSLTIFQTRTNLNKPIQLLYVHLRI